MLAPPVPFEENRRQRMDGWMLLRSLPDACAAAAFFDPQYRAVMDKMAYGNEGARQKARAALPQMGDHAIGCFVEQIARVLRPAGYLFLWTDKFSIGEGQHRRHLAFAPELKVVDLLHWNKCRPGMGRRLRCQSEYMMAIQKPPVTAKRWTDHSLTDCWTEMADRSVHAHAKPRVLTERLIRAVTARGDLVVDPCAGGYGVLDACAASGRRFVGCDLVG